MIEGIKLADSIQLISVFIGSPGGLESERRTARNIVEELNRDHSRHWGCRLELVGWEETLPGHGRPQELINKDLDRCEYFIGILYDHWGSPTASRESKYSSGFEEEFERAKAHINTGAMKDMAIYFKELPAERKRDPGPSLTKVIEFRKACFARKDALYADFADLPGFESLVRAKLNAIGWAEHEKRRVRLTPSERAERPKKQESDSQSTKGEKTALLSAPTEAFLNEMIQRSSEWEDTSATDVARLRLIGSSLYRSGNDDTVIGNHDSNVLFLQRHSIEFSSDEVNALMACGIEGFSHQNVPLWHWLSKKSDGHRQFARLRIQAAFGSENQQANAIRILTLLDQEPLTFGEQISREHVIRAWFQEGVKSDVFTAGVEYLRQHGNADDVPTLAEYYEEAKSQRKSKIGQAIVAIETKLGEAHAINRALELGIDEVKDDLSDQLFSKPSSLTTELLTQCLQSAASSIRRRAISILLDRKETNPLIADNLLSDPDYGVRYFATEALHLAGRTLDDDVVRRALTVVKKGQTFGFLSRTETDTKYYDRYRLNRYSEWKFRDLKNAVDQGGVYDHDVAFALFQQHTRRVKEELRNHLQDGFVSYFQHRLENLRFELGSENKTVLETEKLIPFMRRRLLTVGAEALAGLKDKSDLVLLRHVIDDFEVDVSNALLFYLGRFGDWSDIKRIDGLEEYSSRRVNSLLISTPPALPQKASAMLAIAKKRIADLLEVGFSMLQRRAVLHQLRRNEVVGLSDEVILNALNHDDDECRAIMALKCCEHLPKIRLKALLERYTEHEDYRYYNSIHWLDLGDSMSREVARSVAQKELASRT